MTPGYLRYLCGATFALATLVPGIAQAVPVLWVLSGVTFDDGGTASGSFVFDADSSLYSAIDFTTTDGPVLEGTDHVFEHPAFPSSPDRIVVAEGLPLAIGIQAMNLTFGSQLTNAGGVVPLGGAGGGTFLGIEGLCVTAGCFGVEPFRLVVSGEVRGSAHPVPEPTSLLMLAAGVVAVRLRTARNCRQAQS